MLELSTTFLTVIEQDDKLSSIIEIVFLDLELNVRLDFSLQIKRK